MDIILFYLMFVFLVINCYVMCFFNMNMDIYIKNENGINIFLFCNFMDKIIVDICRIIVCVFILIILMIGNIMVVIVVYWDWKMRIIVNFLIVNMVVFDFLCLVVVILRVLIEIYIYYGFWLIGGIIGLVLCKVVYFL